jgi:hypothetical protein
VAERPCRRGRTLIRGAAGVGGGPGMKTPAVALAGIRRVELRLSMTGLLAPRDPYVCVDRQ